MNDSFYMCAALLEAQKAYAKGEVPVGAVVVWQGQIIGRGHNQMETSGNPLLHAEMLAIQAASEQIKGWRMLEATLYVTLEPCVMCTGAIIHARIGRVVIGTMDAKRGCCGSIYHFPKDRRFNHHPQITTGVMAVESQWLLSSFFQQLRREKRQRKIKCFEDILG